MIRLSAFTAMLMLMLAGCSSTPSVITDHDTGYAFSELNSFRVEMTEQDDANHLLISPFTLSHLQRVIQTNLSDRYQLASDDQTPDFIVRYHIVVEDRLDVRSYDQRYGFGYYGYGRFYRYPYAAQPSPRIYRQGTLILDIAQGEDNKPIWRGVAERQLSESLSPGEQRQRLAAAVTDILANFPPVHR